MLTKCNVSKFVKLEVGLRLGKISSVHNQIIYSSKDSHGSCDFSGGEDGEHEELPLLVGHPALVGQPHRGVSSRRK